MKSERSLNPHMILSWVSPSHQMSLDSLDASAQHADAEEQEEPPSS